MSIAGADSSGTVGLRRTAETIVLLGTRAEIEWIIERLIAALDERDEDPDYEPTLGSLGGTAHDCRLDQRSWAGGRLDDAEEDICDEAHDAHTSAAPSWPERRP